MQQKNSNARTSKIPSVDINARDGSAGPHRPLPLDGNTKTPARELCKRDRRWAKVVLPIVLLNHAKAPLLSLQLFPTRIQAASNLHDSFCKSNLKTKRYTAMWRKNA
eukprot:5329208-Amphidinium_carterae.1